MDEGDELIERLLKETAHLAINPERAEQIRVWILDQYVEHFKRPMVLVPYEGLWVEPDFGDSVRLEDGIIAYRYILSRGWLVVVIKQIYNYKLAISKHSKRFYDDVWCYEDGMSAILSLVLNTWEYGDEPLGWIRHPSSGRRREYGQYRQLKREWIEL